MPASPLSARTGTSTWLPGKPNSSASRIHASVRRRSLPHLLMGVLLVMLCTTGFVAYSLETGHRQQVLALARPVAVGQVLTARDLEQVGVAADSGVAVLRAEAAGSVIGRTMTTGLSAGSLLTAAAVSSAGTPPPGQGIASLALKPGQFPPEVAAGAHVSVVSAPTTTPGTGLLGAAPSTWPAIVTTVTSPANQQLTVVSLQLDTAEARQIAAMPAGQLSLVVESPQGAR